jgi:uncharacterized protein (DUF1800 family)
MHIVAILYALCMTECMDMRQEWLDRGWRQLISVPFNIFFVWVNHFVISLNKGRADVQNNLYKISHVIIKHIMYVKIISSPWLHK